MIPYYNETLKPLVDVIIKDYTTTIDLMTAFKMMQDDTSDDRKIYKELDDKYKEYLADFDHSTPIKKTGAECRHKAAKFSFAYMRTVMGFQSAYGNYKAIYNTCLYFLSAVAYEKKDNGYCYWYSGKFLVGKDTAILDKVTYFKNNSTMYMRSLLNFLTYYNDIDLLKEHILKQKDNLELLYEEIINLRDNVLENGIPLL